MLVQFATISSDYAVEVFSGHLPHLFESVVSPIISTLTARVKQLLLA